MEEESIKTENKKLLKDNNDDKNKNKIEENKEKIHNLHKKIIQINKDKEKTLGVPLNLTYRDDSSFRPTVNID